MIGVLYLRTVKRSHLHSQNFIRRPALVKTLIGHSDLKKSDVIFDVGAGSGVISSVLAGACAHVTAIEFDRRMADKLRENTKRFSNVDIIVGDFMTMKLPDTPYKVFSNIPFHLSSPILHKLTESSNPPVSTYLIVQRQFAKKLIIGESSSFTGLLGAMIAPWFTTRMRYKLERTDFWPHPAVDTAMVEILKRKEPLLERGHLASYSQFVEQCYARQKFFATLPAKIIGDKRPSQLTTEQWVELYHSSKST